jgi:hypothetical protein
VVDYGGIMLFCKTHWLADFVTFLAGHFNIVIFRKLDLLRSSWELFEINVDIISLNNIYKAVTISQNSLIFLIDQFVIKVFVQIYTWFICLCLLNLAILL